MKKTSFTILLSIMTLAMLVFSAAAQAGKGGVKGPNPGADNPGTQTTTYPYFAIGFSGGDDDCFESASFCDAVNLQFGIQLTAQGTPPDSSAWALGQAAARWACRSSADADASYYNVFLAGGVFELNNHGLNGSMHHIEMAAGMLTASAVRVEADAFSSANIGTRAYVAGAANASEDICADIDVTLPFIGPVDIADFCAWANGNAQANAEARAMAHAMSDGWGSAGSGSTAGLGTWVGVWAANIEEFHSVVAAGAKNYAWAEASANAQAVADTFVNAYMNVYEQACFGGEVIFVGEFELCNEGYASARVRARAHAETFAAAQADAMIRTKAGMLLPATYINESGNMEDDTIFFGLEPGYGYWSDGELSVSCDAPSP